MLALLAQAAETSEGLATIGRGLVIGLAAIGPGIGLGRPDRQVRRGHGPSARVRRAGASDHVHRHRADRGAGPVRHRVLVHHLGEEPHRDRDDPGAPRRKPRKRSTTRRISIRTGRSSSWARSRSRSCSSSCGSGCFPRLNTMLEERRAKIQGELEKAETTRQEADQLLADYRAQLAELEGGGQPHHRGGPRGRRPGPGGHPGRGRTRKRRPPCRGPRRRSASNATGSSPSCGRRSARSPSSSPDEWSVQSLDESAHARLIDDYIDEVTQRERAELTWRATRT